MKKAEVRTLVRSMLDDESREIWSDATLDMLIEIVLDDLWADILDTSAWSTSQLDVLTSLVSPGFVDLRPIVDGGQLTQRFYRIQSVVRNGYTYSYTDPRHNLIDNNLVLIGGPYTYSVYGYQLYLFGPNGLELTPSVEVRYNYRPAKFTGLAETDIMPFLDGQESALIYLAALQAMSRAKVEAKQGLAMLAEQSRQRMMSSVRRQYVGPIVPFSTDGPTN